MKITTIEELKAVVENIRNGNANNEKELVFEDVFFDSNARKALNRQLKTLKVSDLSFKGCSITQLDLSGLEIEKLEINDIGRLTSLNVSNTKIAKLPFDRQDEIPTLKSLHAENLKLDEFPRFILESNEWQLHERKSAKETENPSQNERHAYVHGTRVADTLPHFFTGESLETKELRVNFWKNANFELDHHATVVFLGEASEKRNVICRLFGVSDYDFVKCRGQEFVRTKTPLQVDDKSSIPESVKNYNKRRGVQDGSRLVSDAELNMWLLSSKPNYMSTHGLFMPENALYVILLDTENPLDLQRKADYWVRFVKYSVNSADILFLLKKEPDNGVDVIDFKKFAVHTHCHVHNEIACISSDEQDDKTIDIARAILIHAIQRLHSYSSNVPRGWTNVLNRVREHYQVYPKLSYGTPNSAFEKLCKNFLGFVPSEVFHKKFRELLVEAGLCYDVGEKFLYSRAWLACFVSATMDFAAKNYGEVRPYALKSYLEETVEQYDYYDSEIEALLKSLSNPKENLQYLCIKWSNNVDVYFFPQFSFMKERPYGSSVDKSHTEKMNEKKWTERWTAISKNFFSGQYFHHFIIDMPLLSSCLLVDILCRMAKSLSDKSTANYACGIDTDEIALGADGLIAMLDHKNDDSVNDNELPLCLFVDGVPSHPGRFQIFVGLYNPNGQFYLPDTQNEIVHEKFKLLINCAFMSLFEATKKYRPLATNMTTYLALPNDYLGATIGRLRHRIALRDIVRHIDEVVKSEKAKSNNNGECKCKHCIPKYPYLEGELSIGKLQNLVPLSFMMHLSESLGKKYDIYYDFGSKCSSCKNP